MESKNLLRKVRNLRSVGEVKKGRQASARYKDREPDLIVLDISLTDTKSVDILKEIMDVDPMATILILSRHDDECHGMQFLDTGVKRYVLKGKSHTELRNSIDEILKGNSYFGGRVPGSNAGLYNETQKKQITQASITKREVEILALTAQGLTSQQMASRLFIGVRTVETHRANIMRKLGAKNTVELVTTAMKLNLVSG